MSEENTTPDQITPDQTDGPTEAEIKESLRAKLRALGGNPGNMGIDALRNKIKELMDEPKADPEADAPAVANAAPLSKGQIRAKQRKEELKLVRVRISNMDPSKTDLRGEIFTVRTKYLGIMKKFIPFGEATENGYHIPYIFYKQLKSRKYLHKSAKTNPKTGQIEVKTRWVPEFALEVMDPLTPEELERMKIQQAAAAGMSDD